MLFLEKLRLDVENCCDVNCFVGFSAIESNYKDLAKRYKESKIIIHSLYPCTPCLKTAVFEETNESVALVVRTIIQNVSRQTDLKSLYNVILAVYAELSQDDIKISIGDVKHIQNEILYEIENLYKNSGESNRYEFVNKLEVELRNYAKLDLILHAITGAIEIFDKTNERKSQTANSLAVKIKEYIDEHFCEKISLDDLSGALYMNKEYISRTFKKGYGISVFDYIDSRKIAKSNELLAIGKSISEVCNEIGYYDVSHFYKKYKKIMGYNPKTSKK